MIWFLGDRLGMEVASRNREQSRSCRGIQDSPRGNADKRTCNDEPKFVDCRGSGNNREDGSFNRLSPEWLARPDLSRGRKRLRDGQDC